MHDSLCFWAYMISIAVNAVMTAVLFRKRHASGAKALMFVLLCCSVWSFGSAMETCVPDLAGKLFWTGISYPAHTFGPVVWFIMILQLTDHRQWASWKNILLLCIMPVITSLFAVTGFHGLMWTYGTLQRNVLSLTYGPWFWIHMAFASVLDLLSVTLAIRFWKRQAPYFGKRYACLVIPVIVVWLINTPYLFKLGLSVDLTPIAWGASTPFIFWALFRDNLFDIVPIARYHVMENVNSGIVLMDRKDHVVDLNPAACGLFACQARSTVGMEAHDFFRDWPELLRQIEEGTDQIEFRKTADPADTYYVSSCFKVKQKEKILGRMLIVRDVTEERRTQAELLDTQRRMAVQGEQERMARDLHDDMGQIMGFVNVQTQAINEYLRHGQMEEAQKCLTRLSEVSRQAHDHVRETILEMRGESAKNEWTAATYLQKLAQELRLFERNTGIAVRDDFEGVSGLMVWASKPTLQMTKMIREALHNVREHSGATEAAVQFMENGDTLMISVSDNGRGFDTETPTPGGHFGLTFMRERVEEMGGSFSVRSKMGAGTVVAVNLPLTAVLAREECRA